MNKAKEALQMKAMEIISNSGSAKSSYLEALQYAKAGQIAQAKQTMEEGRGLFTQAHILHFDLVAKEMSGEDLPLSLIIIHAEDQLLSTETVEILVDEMITLYETVQGTAE